MTSEPSLGKPEGSKSRKGNADRRDRPRPLLANFQGIPMPKFEFKIPSIVDTNLVARAAANAARLASLSLPESTLNNLINLPGIASQQSKLADSLRPLLDPQGGWLPQFDRINSDLFKTHATTQEQFAKLGTNLAKTIDFGISDSVAKLAEQFTAQQASWLKTLEPTLEQFKKSFYPPNLRRIEDLAFGDVEKVVMADGIALYGVPRTSIAESLVRAESAAKRREILGRRWNAISADCRKVAERLSTTAVAPYKPFAMAALDALDNGHTEAAQALTGSLIDSLLTAYFGETRTKYTPAKNGKRTTEAYDEFTFHQFIAFAPMWQAYQQFWVQDGDRVPNTFSRNATAHTVSPRQFNRRNAVQALLFGISLLFFFDEQAARLASR
ncbi:hypothetical protein [Mycolicibacter kumamotonensis]|uniref:Uncharacterized protein n=1 Tax=Mycolicibacter kumamotonensis TaxID=354243 RepID=A0A1B8SCQ6_9MYCO|nr:hypothetical protein [Mycolicibacter kumamotonensis]OBY30504.1 hypothetical protein ACT18_17335 [Mycolicibacter kumamotonensis]